MVLQEYINKVAAKLQITDATEKLDIKDWINIAVRKIFEYYPQLLVKEDFCGNTFERYKTGTVAITKGATALTGSGVTWTSSMVGKKVRIGEGDTNYKYYVISAYVSASALTLAEAYTEATETAANYQIYQDEYNMPSDFWKPVSVCLADRQLTKINERDFLDSVPSIERTNAGTPSHYRIAGINNTPFELSAAAAVDLVSTSVSDTTQSVTIYGLVNSKNDSESVTLTGTSTASTTKTFSKIHYIKMNTVALGQVTISYTGGTVIARLLPDDLEYNLVTRYKTLRLYPIPFKEYPIFVRYYQDIPALEDDSDYVEMLDDTFDEYIIARAYIEGLYFYGDEQKASALEQKWKNDVGGKLGIEQRLDGTDYNPQMGFGIMAVSKNARRPLWFEPGGDQD